jgi:hypothetical protein
MKAIIFGALFFTISLFSSFASAEVIHAGHGFVVSLKSNHHYDTLHYDGIIGDGSHVVLYILINEHKPDVVTLNSPGGYVDQSLSIGRYFHKNGIPVRILEGDVCLSACAFAAIGSENLSIDGKLAFHTPYLPKFPTDKTLQDITNQHSTFVMKLVTYFNDVDYSSALLVEIFRRSSRENYVTFSSEEDLAMFRKEDFFDSVSLPFKYYEMVKGSDFYVQ